MTLEEALTHDDARVPHLSIFMMRSAKTRDHRYTAVRTPDGHTSVKQWVTAGGTRVGVTLPGISPEVAALEWLPFQQIGPSPEGLYCDTVLVGPDGKERRPSELFRPWKGLAA